jgi:hypothetical protein
LNVLNGTVETSGRNGPPATAEMGPRSAAGGRSNQSFTDSTFAPGALGGADEGWPRKRGIVHGRGSRCRIAAGVVLSPRAPFAFLFALLALAACRSSNGPGVNEPFEVDAQSGRASDDRDGAAWLVRDADDGVGDDAGVPVDRAQLVDIDTAADAPASDGRRVADGRARLDAGREAGHPPHTCVAGGLCGAAARCERSCNGQEIYRCTCAEGRFICTGCFSVDAGVPDVARTGTCAGNVSLQGRRCDQAGDVCQFAADGGARLCACGDVGPERLWICQ